MSFLLFLSALSATCEPEELVRILNDLFARFDKLANVSTVLSLSGAHTYPNERALC